MNETGPRPLDGQTALVTGANSGIGAAVARALGHAGAGVAVNYVTDPEAAEAVAADVREAGSRALPVRADVSAEDEVRAMFREVREELGDLDVLVANAGIQRDAPVLEMSLEEWNAVLAVNLTGAFLCAREAAREFVRRGVREEVSRAAGKIIFLSSVHEEIPWAGHVNYATSKGGARQLMRSMAQELGPRKVRVNSIAPGAIRTPINREAWERPEKAAALRRLICYGRIGEPEDIARVAVWLASDESDYVHGITLFVDGGMTLYPGFSTGG